MRLEALPRKQSAVSRRIPEPQAPGRKPGRVGGGAQAPGPKPQVALEGSVAPEEAVSRFLCPPEGGWHPFLWPDRYRQARAAYPGALRVSGTGGGGPLAPLFGLAPHGVCHAPAVAGRAVGSYPTFSPLPGRPGRYVFCGTFPRVAAAGRYPACFHPEFGLSSFLRKGPRAPASSGAAGIVLRWPARGRGAVRRRSPEGAWQSLHAVVQGAMRP